MTNPLHDTLFAPLRGSDRPFIHWTDGATITGDAFADMVARAAGALLAAGLKPGDRVALQAAKTPQALAVYGGAAAAGIVFLPLNTAYTVEEVSYFVEDSGAGLLIADPAAEAGLGPVAERLGARLMTLDAQGKGSFAGLCDRQPATFAAVARGEEDLAALLYTSGTTGRSKGAMLTQKNLLSNALTLVGEWRFGADDVLLHALPIFHTHGLFVATNVVLGARASMIFQPGFNVDAIVEALPRATTMMGVPTFYTRLLQHPGFTRDLVSHMRLFVSGSAPLLAETHKEFEEVSGHRILERYGMTETNMNTSNPYDGDRRAGTVGRPLPGVELRITGETGEALPAGEVGMIEVRGPNVFKGYWQMPDKTREELRDNGFFITGDLGVQEEDGYVRIVGRQKDLVISGGYNVYPKEVEQILDELPGVLESAVIGVPHPDFGEAVFGVLVTAPGEEIDTAQARLAIRDRLAAYKQPKAIVTVASLPRNTMGKVQKNLLRQEYSDYFR